MVKGETLTCVAQNKDISTGERTAPDTQAYLHHSPGACARVCDQS